MAPRPHKKAIQTTLIESSLLIFLLTFGQLTVHNVQCRPNQPTTLNLGNSGASTTAATPTIGVNSPAQPPTNTTASVLVELAPNQVTSVDLRLRENSQRHHTNIYRQMSPSNPYSLGPSLIARRGEWIYLHMLVRRPYDLARDRLRLEASFGQSASLDRGTLIYTPLSKNLNSSSTWNQAVDPLKWAAQITQIRSSQLEARIWIPANCSIGIWRLKLSCKLVNSRELQTFSVRESLVVLFNAWSKDDTVYLHREDARQEYVLNEIGKVYMGSYQRPTGTRWQYGQFSEYVLPGMLMLLERTRLDVTQRGDVVKISRAISATMNSHDDMGLLVGNWSGNYNDGVSPWSWSNSATIFERYVKSNGRPVKFGQCWVFGGLTTTALRTLGIPARTITNFVSAHDTDLSLTVDQFNSDRGEKISGINGDSIWNFHVWSDAWMLRDDLPPEYSGWQAIDATPQETSMGVYQLGPASVEAVKRGKVTFAYDVGFVYSEVNADVVTWRLDSRSPFQWRRTVAQTDHVGKTILTKQIGKLDDLRYGVADAEDITHQYKFRDGSRDERLSYNDASKLAGLDLILQQ